MWWGSWTSGRLCKAPPRGGQVCCPRRSCNWGPLPRAAHRLIEAKEQAWYCRTEKVHIFRFHLKCKDTWGSNMSIFSCLHLLVVESNWSWRTSPPFWWSEAWDVRCTEQPRGKQWLRVFLKWWLGMVHMCNEVMMGRWSPAWQRLLDEETELWFGWPQVICNRWLQLVWTFTSAVRLCTHFRTFVAVHGGF